MHRLAIPPEIPARVAAPLADANAALNAALSDAEHNASLAAFWQIFGDVMTVDHVIARLDAARAKEAA